MHSTGQAIIDHPETMAQLGAQDEDKTKTNKQSTTQKAKKMSIMDPTKSRG